MTDRIIMKFNKNEINLLRQWFNSIQDLNQPYLKKEDYIVYLKIMKELKMRPSDSTFKEYQEAKPLGESYIFWDLPEPP